jgi:hypothetical protein
MYIDYNGREQEDTEMDAMLEDARSKTMQEIVGYKSAYNGVCLCLACGTLQDAMNDGEYEPIYKGKYMDEELECYECGCIVDPVIVITGTLPNLDFEGSEYQQWKEELDQMLRGTQFEISFTKKFDTEKEEFTDEIEGVAIWKKGYGPRDLVTTICDAGKFETIKEFMLTLMQMNVRQEDIYQMQK